jgi:chromosome segregation ATPase
MQDPNRITSDDPVQDKRAKIHRIQTDLAIIDADLNKIERTIEEIKLKLKGDKHKKDELELEIGEEETQLNKLEGEQMMLIVEIRKLRKKMNLLT